MPTVGVRIGVGRRRRAAGGTAPSNFAVSGTLADAQYATLASLSLNASGGTPPYTVTGLPSGLSAVVTGGSIAISGTPT